MNKPVNGPRRTPLTPPGLKPLVIKWNRNPEVEQTLVEQEDGLEPEVEVTKNFCDNCNHAACNVGREFDAAVLHYKRGLEKSKKLVEDFHKELEVMIASRPQEGGQILAAISALLQETATTQSNRKVVEEESLRPEATGNAAYDKSRDPRRRFPKENNTFSQNVVTSPLTLQW